MSDSPSGKENNGWVLCRLILQKGFSSVRSRIKRNVYIAVSGISILIIISCTRTAQIPKSILHSDRSSSVGLITVCARACGCFSGRLQKKKRKKNRLTETLFASVEFGDGHRQRMLGVGSNLTRP